VIVGGGHAGAALCHGLAAAGLGARTHIVCDEPELPYQRPPLSKAFLKSDSETVQLHRNESWYSEAGITLYRADPVVAIDRAARTLALRSGRVLPFGQLVLATGARARSLQALPASLTNVAVLRTEADARRLRDQLASASNVTVLGGGFIGLEVAATARALSKNVAVFEAAPRLLQRSVSPELAEHVFATHRASGIDVRLGAAVEGFEVDRDRLVRLVANGRRENVELLILGIGAAPETRLAQQAGLACEDGVLVDAFMRSSDVSILAIGDCARFSVSGDGGQRQRLESVQNANDQARTAVATLLGAPVPYRALPWFWSEQGSMRLQMAGLAPEGATRHHRPGPIPASFSILHYSGDRLACVESVNAPLDHMAARKLLDAGLSPDPATACDPARPLKQSLPAG
jgi:3-phenylpropionate/trans-cinnamate dioxygenase ferredoxin reductase subunit